MPLTLVIGNKNYSSWSMRPWMALRGAGIPFDEVVIPLYTGAEGKGRILSMAPSGKVPILIDGDVTVWDSLAIIEYVAETYADTPVWPSDRVARAHARAISAEMHSGFAALRTECGMNLRRPVRPKQLSDEAKADIMRIQAIWEDCRSRFAPSGPFLFGPFSAADAMYAPVVHRFRTYAVDGSSRVRDYMETLQTHPDFVLWTEAALAEEWVIERFETA